MGLFQRAIETYDAMAHLVGVEQEGKETLAPVGHIMAKATVMITIDRDGNFISAQSVEQKITIPVTEESAGRTSGPAAHCLCDYFSYVGTDVEKKHSLYLAQLQKWVDSPYTHPKVEAVLRYAQKGTVHQDMETAGLKAEEKDMICWSVIGFGDTDGPVWTDRTVQKRYKDFYLSEIIERERVLCMVTGEETVPAIQHLKGVVPINGNARLISSNDTTNFTYRGRFLNDTESLTVGYEASQKAHNALKWLVATQGVRQGGRTFLCWNPKGKQVFDPFAVLCNAESKPADLEDYRQKLFETLTMCRQAIPEQEAVVFCAFDAATTGRLSVDYYNEFSSKDFFDRLQHWDTTCVWYDGFGGVGAPSLKRIVLNAFGLPRGAKSPELDDRVFAQQMQRLVLCRVEKKAFPTDVMRAIVQKAGNMQIYTAGASRNTLLATACAVVKKYRFDRFKEEWSLALEKDNQDRSYQFGRLLAVLDKAEGDVLRKRGEDRDTNALRMQSVFVRRPNYAAKVILDQLKTAYYPRMTAGTRAFYEQLIGEIYEKISDCCATENLNAPLKETYLLGYYLQRNDLYKKKENHENTEESENV